MVKLHLFLYYKKRLHMAISVWKGKENTENKYIEVIQSVI